jgi:GT2 family glycosyltransferase
MSVALGYVHGGTVRAEFMTSVLGVMNSARSPVRSVLDAKSGPNISRARNMLVEQFLDTGLDWLLMADTDMVFAPDTVTRLLRAADPEARPVVGALCFSQKHNGDPASTIYMAREIDGGLLFIPAPDWPEETVMLADATGAGFLLVHRSVFGRIREAVQDEAAPWFRETVSGTTLIGEDLTFCVRAAMAGIPVHVHTGVQVGHVKTAVLGKVT